MWSLPHHAVNGPLLILLEWMGPCCVALCLLLQHAFVLCAGLLSNIPRGSSKSPNVFTFAQWFQHDRSANERCTSCTTCCISRRSGRCAQSLVLQTCVAIIAKSLHDPRTSPSKAPIINRAKCSKLKGFADTLKGTTFVRCESMPTNISCQL